jgi:hypothetical protein
MNKWFDSRSKIVRILLLIPIWGWVIAGLYRVFKYLNGKKATSTLVFGVLFIVPFIGFFGSIIDIITTATEDKITLFAD